MRLTALSKSVPAHMDQFENNISLVYGEENNRVMGCVKTLLVLFNLVCLVTGIALIYSGMSVLAIFTSHALFTESQSLAPPSLLVFVGLLVTVIASMGIVGVLKESVCMIFSFSFILGIIFMFEISLSLTGLVYQSEIRDILSHSMSRAVRDYGQDPVARQAVDTLQYQLSCCGVQNPSDWNYLFTNTTSTFNKSSDVITPNNSDVIVLADSWYPDSCCQSRLVESGKWTCQVLFSSGCLDKLDSLMKISGRALLMMALGVATVQFLGIIFACSLGKLIRLQKSERERLKWEFRNHLLQTRNPGNFETFVRDTQIENNKL